MNKHDESSALVKQWNVFLAIVFPWNSEKNHCSGKKRFYCFHKKQMKKFNNQKKENNKNTQKKWHILWNIFLFNRK